MRVSAGTTRGGGKARLATKFITLKRENIANEIT